MKTLSLLVVLLIPALMFAQDFENIPLKTLEDCKKAESKVIEAANYLLSKPMDCGDKNCVNARKLIIEWQTNTEYTFNLDGQIMDLTKDNDKLLGIIMASMSKFLLENKADAKDWPKIKAGSYGLVADYAEKTTNGVKATKPIKKLIDAKKKGSLGDYSKSEK